MRDRIVADASIRHMEQRSPASTLRELIERWQREHGQQLTENELARRTRVPQPTIHRILSGESKDPRRQTLRPLAKFFGVEVGEIAGDSPRVTRSADLANVVREPAAVYTAERAIPLISWVQAGSWMSSSDPYPPGVADTWVAYTGPISDTAFALTVRGDSMTAVNGLPTFPEGTIIVVDPAENPEHRDFVIAKLGDSEEVTFKQLLIEGDRSYLAPLNPRYPVLPIDQPCSICGVVVAIAQMQIRTKRR